MLHPSIKVFEPALFGKVSREVDASRDESLAMICHEMRNSLAIVRGAARLLRSTTSGDALTTTSTLIERQAVQMNRYIDDLLQPQRCMENEEGLQLEDMDLRDIARGAADAVGPEMALREHRFAVRLPDKPLRVHADSGRLGQAFFNLLINAAKYTPNGGSITLMMERDRDTARVRVRDTGVGLEPAMLTRIFGMFVQVGGAMPTAGKGSGIGLAVVENIVGLHGGTVKATSPGLGLGSEFAIVLPAPRA